MRILITGASGFSAKYLIPSLSARADAELFFTDFNRCEVKNWHACDLTDFNSVLSLMKTIKPDRVFHLAGSFTNNYSCDYNSNVLTTKNLLDSILDVKRSCRLLLIGSCAEYGKIRKPGKPVSEKEPLNPLSVYGLTKAFQSHLMKFYFLTHKSDVVMARTFNLYGEGISNKLFAGKLYEQINEYKTGKITRIILGNLHNKRDYIHIEDAVEYYLIIMNYGLAGEVYNVGSGKSKKTSELLEDILAENGIPVEAVEARKDLFLNKTDIGGICADNAKLLRLKRVAQEK